MKSSDKKTQDITVVENRLATEDHWRMGRGIGK
jgi:hypothetical protein